jgi:hypothetical protein
VRRFSLITATAETFSHNQDPDRSFRYGLLRSAVDAQNGVAD